MKKIDVNRIVSLILEQIKTNTIDPTEFTFIGDRSDLAKYPELLFDQSSKNQEGQFDEMAQKREYEQEKLPEPMRIPVDELVLGPKTPQMPPIKCLDPDTNELVENMVIGNLILTTPAGKRFLVFENKAGREGIDVGGKKRENYVALPEKRFITDKPRGSVYGKPIPKDVIKSLEIAPEGESDEEREKRLKRIFTLKEANAKRLLYPSVNQMFSKHQILDHLDICLIPETWANTLRTEHTWNKIRLKRFGGASPEIDADFFAVRDLTDIDQTVDSVMDLRAALALGEAGFDTKREREVSKHAPRRHANYIYTAGGNWEGRQRVHDEEFFQEAGAKTMVYHLNSKNIQEGSKNISIESVLHIVGNIQGDNYVLTANFNVTLNARDKETGEGKNRGNLIDPISVSLSKPIPADINRATFNMNEFPEFWVNEGRKTGGSERTQRTGFLPSLIDKLGNAMLETIDPDDVQMKIIQLSQEFVEMPENNEQ